MAIYDALGVSVIGPHHVRLGAANQDSYVARCTDGHGCIIAVCDGMGSKQKAEHGARMACKAVLQSSKSFIVAAKDLDEYAKEIVYLWNRLLLPYAAKNCRTTCLIAWKDSNSNDVLLAQLGDGMVLFRKKGVVQFLTHDYSKFGNETDGLGAEFDVSSWTFSKTSLANVGDGVLLMSDGVSDDLQSEMLPSFYEWILKNVGSFSHRSGKKWLKKQLKNWPTPFHSDDKTIAVMLLKKK